MIEDIENKPGDANKQNFRLDRGKRFALRFLSKSATPAKKDRTSEDEKATGNQPIKDEIHSELKPAKSKSGAGQQYLSPLSTQNVRQRESPLRPSSDCLLRANRSVPYASPPTVDAGQIESLFMPSNLGSADVDVFS
jgi:hypothetical protein